MSRARKRLTGWLLTVPAAIAVAGEIPDPTASPIIFMVGVPLAAFGAALIHQNGPRRPSRVR